MKRLGVITRVAWLWMAVVAIIYGITCGYAFGEQGYYHTEFDGGAMVLGFLAALILLAPIQFFLAVSKEVITQQEKQTSSLAALRKALAPKPPKKNRK